MTERALVEKALSVRENAYAPYSRFQVGAALLAADGTVYLGCNVESAAFGAGQCAERGAVSAAVAAGRGPGDFAMLAVAGGGLEFCVPCGVCRQLLYEFAPHLPVLCANEAGGFIRKTLDELLPSAFGGFPGGKETK